MKKENKDLKILFLSQRFLFPQDSGGKIRTGKILEHLKKQFSITVISNVEPAKDNPYMPEMKKLCDKFIQVPWVETKRFTLKWYLEILKKSFSIYPVTMLNDYSPELEEAVLKELANDSYDLAICDFMQSTLNFRNVKNIPTLLFQHNVESTIPQRHTQRAKEPISKIFWWLQYRKMFYHERKECQRFDAVVAVSGEDRRRFEDWYGLSNVRTIPTGVDTEHYSPDNEINEEKSIVFVGSMDWLPNHDAMTYFIDRIFPLIKAEEGDAKLVIVGRKPSAQFLKSIHNRPDIEATGWVDDTRPYIARSSVFVVPIRIGGGTRMKIYEGMAMGKACVSTTVGAEGLPIQNGEHIYLADTEREFANAVITLLQNKELRQEVGARARQYVYENFRWEKVAENFARICFDITEKQVDNHKVVVANN